MPLNEPGKWKYFISHVQRECSTEAVMLAAEWGKQHCWVDRFMEDKSVAAMEEGVTGSETFVCILSEGYFASKYCCDEMRWAFKNEKPIISTYKNGVNVGALLNTAPDDFRDRIMAIDSIALNASDPDYFDVGMKKITKRLGALRIVLNKEPPSPAEEPPSPAEEPPSPAEEPPSPAEDLQRTASIAPTTSKGDNLMTKGCMVRKKGGIGGYTKYQYYLENEAGRQLEKVEFCVEKKKGDYHITGTTNAILHVNRSSCQLTKLPDEKKLLEVEFENSLRNRNPGAIAVKHYSESGLETRWENKKPTWNSKANMYQLDFKGRAGVASCKNFQLHPKGGDNNDVCFLLGKTDDQFNLDFKAPFSSLQAVGVALALFDSSSGL